MVECPERDTRRVIIFLRRGKLPHILVRRILITATVLGGFPESPDFPG